jgi:hypothetical protein
MFTLINAEIVGCSRGLGGLSYNLLHFTILKSVSVSEETLVFLSSFFMIGYRMNIAFSVCHFMIQRLQARSSNNDFEVRRKC